jgi:4-alpha-glucanotransferase
MTTGQTGSIHLGLLLHNHQPVGNFPWVFQQVYEESYLPMIEALERHPRVRLSLHYTGSLLDWFTEAQPAFLQRIRALVERKQVEIVSGGYYEPILPSIPDADKVGQIRRLNARIQSEFGMQPTGMWTAERVWEPGLPRSLREAGIEWTVLDDVHFKNVGLEDHELYGYYATEDISSVLKVYATSKQLRYTIPWRPPQESIASLRTLTTLRGNRIAVMGDDGEKFGSWPGTQDYCWGSHGRNGWMDQFLSALEENSDWLHTTPLGEYANKYPALGRVYIPTSSYIEMTEWALPAHKSFSFGKLLHELEEKHQEQILQFMRGGFWRNFLVKYPEVNNQHKKMLRVHQHVYEAGAVEEHGLIELWKAQANDTYWHGLFGGIYMAHVRAAIYKHLIQAENAADRVRHPQTHWQAYEFTDFDRDTQQRLIIESDQQNLYLDPQLGGSLFEWDIRRSAHNLLSVMTRHEESYHRTLREYEQERRRNAARAGQRVTAAVGQSGELESPHSAIRTKEPDLDQYLVIDRYRRNSLIDHFLPAGLPLSSFAQGRFEDLGDFVDQPYTSQVEQNEQSLKVTFTRNGQVRRMGALSSQEIKVTKTLFLPLGSEEIQIRYALENKSQSRFQGQFAIEWNTHFLGGGGNQQAYYHFPEQPKQNALFDSTGIVEDVHEVHVGNTWLEQDLGFRVSTSATLWRFSIDTVTGSEAGFERTHQGSCLTFLWSLLLESGQQWQVEMLCKGSKA